MTAAKPLRKTRPNTGEPTIREHFDDRFADHKEKVIDLLARVTAMGVETMKMFDAMRSASR
jgi:predicted helicase